jgi:BASS family bile acid:Na+ symporter
LAIVTLPLNFALIASLNPQTAAFLKGEMGTLDVDSGGIITGLLLMLVLPLLSGMLVGNLFARFTRMILPLFKRLSMSAFGLFLGIAIYSNWQMLVESIGLIFLLVIAQNAAALLLGWSAATVAGVPEVDRRALTIEVGMQNSGLALGLILTQFGAQPDMALVAALWGTWHIVSGLLLVLVWRSRVPRPHKEHLA